MFQRILLGKKKKKRFLQINLQHFLFRLCVICFSALVTGPALRRSAGSRGLYLWVLPTGSSPVAVPAGLRHLPALRAVISSCFILLGCQPPPCYLPRLSPAPREGCVGRRCQVEAWAAAVRKKSCILHPVHWERGQCSPETAATALSSSTAAFLSARRWQFLCFPPLD